MVQVSAGVRFGPGKVYVRTTGAVFAVSVSAGGSMTGTVAAPVLPAIGLPGRRLAIQRQAQDLAERLVGVLGRRHALPVARA